MGLKISCLFSVCVCYFYKVNVCVYRMILMNEKVCLFVVLSVVTDPTIFFRLFVYGSARIFKRTDFKF